MLNIIILNFHILCIADTQNGVYFSLFYIWINKYSNILQCVVSYLLCSSIFCILH